MFFVGRAVRATPRRPWLVNPAQPVSLRNPASLTDRPTLPVSALATMLLAHTLAFTDTRLTAASLRQKKRRNSRGGKNDKGVEIVSAQE
jgi:hypothetical protein